MALCEQCGSISIVKAQPTTGDKVVAFFTAKRPFLCRRCGWRARRGWSDFELDSLRDYGAGGAHPDPALGVLDDNHHRANDEEQVIARRAMPNDPREKEVATFEPEALDFVTPVEPSAMPTEPATAEATVERAERKPRAVRKRRSRMIGREIAVTIAVTSIIMAAGVALITVGSCIGFGS